MFYDLVCLGTHWFHIYRSTAPGKRWCILGLYSLSGKTCYRQITWIFEAARFDVMLIVSLGNLIGTSAVLLPMHLMSNFGVISNVYIRISWLRYFTRSCDKTPPTYWMESLENKSHELTNYWWDNHKHQQKHVYNKWVILYLTTFNHHQTGSRSH